MWRIEIDRDRCEGHGLCAATAPTVFHVDDNDVMHVLSATPPDSLREAVEQAERRCPKQAISIVDTA